MQFEVSLSSPCTATVSGWGGIISGETVAFSQIGGTGSVTFPSPVTCVLSTVGGVPSCGITVTGTSAGAVTIEATYGGDADNVGSSGATTFTVRLLTTVAGRPFPPIVTTTTTTTTAVSSDSSVTIGPTTTTKTSANQSSTQSLFGGFGSSTYLILTALAVVLTAFGAMIWRRRSTRR